MIYQGSKARLKKYIVPILQKCIDDNDVGVYIEPFVGGANIIDSIRCKFRIGSDNNSELIELLQYMSSDTELSIFPEECSFEHYSEVRENRKFGGDKFSTCYTAGIGYFASYGGRYFDGGYGRDSRGAQSIYTERVKAARRQAPLLKGITFFDWDYWVFISEYYMPDDFECIWQKQRKVLQKSDRLKADVATEKLFVYRR